MKPITIIAAVICAFVSFVFFLSLSSLPLSLSVSMSLSPSLSVSFPVSSTLSRSSRPLFVSSAYCPCRPIPEILLSITPLLFLLFFSFKIGFEFRKKKVSANHYYFLSLIYFLEEIFFNGVGIYCVTDLAETLELPHTCLCFTLLMCFDFLRFHILACFPRFRL